MDGNQDFTPNEARFEEGSGGNAGYTRALDSFDLSDPARVSPAAPSPVPASRTPALMAGAAPPQPPAPAAAPATRQDTQPARKVETRGLLGRLFGWLLGAR